MHDDTLSTLMSGAMPRTGIDVIDDQHGEMLDAIHRLQAAVRSGQGASVLEEIVIFLADYTQTHFAFEEFAMKGAHYPGAARHVESHEHFTRRFKEFQRRFEEAALAGRDVSLLSEATAEWLRGWLEAHIPGEDAAMAEYLTRHRRAC